MILKAIAVFLFSYNLQLVSICIILFPSKSPNSIKLFAKRDYKLLAFLSPCKSSYNDVRTRRALPKSASALGKVQVTYGFKFVEGIPNFFKKILHEEKRRYSTFIPKKRKQKSQVITAAPINHFNSCFPKSNNKKRRS